MYPGQYIFPTVIEISDNITAEILSSLAANRQNIWKVDNLSTCVL